MPRMKVALSLRLLLLLNPLYCQVVASRCCSNEILDVLLTADLAPSPLAAVPCLGYV